ncbi:MAG: D-sedoheptulose 7-phosphate isomerase [Hyphomicrobiaceae bacterium]
MPADIRSSFESSRAVLESALADAGYLEAARRAAQLCSERLQAGSKVMLAGNGGSAADAQHIAGELVGRFRYDRPALSAIALTTDTSILTALGNDYGFETVFARQVEAHGRAGDVLMCFSTSGQSANVLAALAAARARSIHTIGFSGSSGGSMTAVCDIILRVPSDDTPRIQEVHIMTAHAICELIERTCFPR